MSEQILNQGSMYESIQGIQELNQVEGFDPRKYMRQLAGDGQGVKYYLDVVYRKLWFRLKYPNGKIVKKLIKLTDQVAIVEAKVYLDRNDPEESFIANALAQKYLPSGSCGVVSFGLAGGREAASTFMKELKLAAIETHVADARTCCLNPASSTHRQMNDEQLAAAGVPAELVRMSCGLESSEDLIADIAQALDKI